MVIIPQTNSIKDLQAAFISLKNEIESLKTKIEALQSKLQALTE